MKTLHISRVSITFQLRSKKIKLQHLAKRMAVMNHYTVLLYCKTNYIIGFFPI